MGIEYRNEKIIVHESDKEIIEKEKEQGVLVVNLDDDPELKELGPIELLGFRVLKDNARDEIMYLKFRPDKKLAIYYLTKHPDGIMALCGLEVSCEQKGYHAIDLRDYLKEVLKYTKEKKEKEKKKEK